MQKERLIIVGNGPVAHKFLENIVSTDNYSNYEVTVIGEESLPAYNRVYLTAWFKTMDTSEIMMGYDDFYDTHNITCIRNEKITHIDRENKLIRSKKNAYSYNKLILATGSFPFVPPVKGHDRPNTFVYRTIDDLEKITLASKTAKTGTVVGGGLLGLEAAKALNDLGLKTNVVEFAPRLMAVQIDDIGGSMLRNKIADLGVDVHTEKNTQQIIDGSEAFHKMEFADGESLETDIIVFSAGIRPQDELARQSDLAIGERGGIIINDYCQTSDPDIYAIGECALWDNRIFGLIAPCNQMAQVALEHICQTGETQFNGFDMSTKLKLMGVEVGSIGDAHERTEGAKTYTLIDQPNEIYKKIVVSSDNTKLLGAVLVGDTSDYDTLLQYALNGIELPEHPDSLILPDHGEGASKGLGIDMLPADAIICSCNNVTKSDICAAVQNGNLTIGDIKSATAAATSCGGCSALATSVMNYEMENLGLEVNTDLCEHFPYTRQELYHLIRVGEITDFSEALKQFGSGYGCDICRPTIGSILASCWNDYILADNLQVVQDTNDYFMGNLQKNGTYSIVPRMAAGEVTPEKLIALGNIAKEYDLYTKLTGGQRIDLFGARQEQLPEIWKKLIAAGFETGHAYGKSLRTVKSCVGSTWCRYGVDDSVGLAIDIENRYKGVRTPHKVKLAVSGCTRECAEAQSKDFGVIATENGWNLYTCGNGGMKPRHADLFATDLDKATLIRYIDRIMMFYIKTADRLQRTSVWFENLDGGLDYLRDVIINDSLAIGDELEEQMQSIIDKYQCEWKTTVEDEDKLKRFSHFVNSDKSDDNVVFVRERDQIKPDLTDENVH